LNSLNYTKTRGARVAIEYLIKKFENEILESGLMNRLYYIRKK